MRVIWTAKFWCEACQKEVHRPLYSNSDCDELPDMDKGNALEILRNYHNLDHHTVCWRCGEHIPRQEIEIFWVEDNWKDICATCAESPE
jgi:hypothetical protein